MDPGRYALQQGWDTNSALEGYGPAHEPDFRPGGSGGRRVPNERFSRESIYSRNAFSGDILDREIYPPVPVSSMWPQSRRRNFNDEDSLSKDSRRPSSFHDMDDFHDPKKYHEIDSFHEVDRFHDRYRLVDSYHDPDGYRDYMFERHAKTGTRDHDDVADHYDLRHRGSYESRENSRERDYDTGRYDYDSDQDKGRRESNWRRHDSREQDREKRSLSWERGQSPYARHYDSRSRGRDDRSRSRSPRSRNGGRSYREDIYDDKRYERFENRWDYDEKHYHSSSVTPSATVVVKGLSLKTTEEDLYQMLAEWGPLRHVRVIKERNSGISRGFAFIDFPSVEAACSMMDGIGENGLTIDGKKLFFEYSSKPTGGAGAGVPALRHEGIGKSGFGYGRSAPPSDWICTICGCVNFARRTSCFQCNEPRTDDAPSADVTPPALLGRKGSDAGPTHVLVVRGLDDNADEEMLRYEFSKHAPIKDLRLVRDKFTHVSRGFAFLHFHSVVDASKALEATNGMTLEKNGQILRVAYAKSIHGPSGAPQSSSLAAAAIEAATFAQQYDSVGWAPKEYNPDDKQSTAAPEQNGKPESQVGGSAPQAGFIWDEKSGYYYDATSGFYYDGNTGLYYDGNNGIWYSYDHQSQQYVPCASQGDTKASEELTSDGAKASTNNNTKKVVISAPASTIKLNESTSLPDAVQAAASAALAAEKKEKEKQKEIKLASKNNLLASKKKMNNVLALWKQRNNEGQAARVVLDDNEQFGLTDDKQNISYSGKNKVKASAASVKESSNSSGFAIESQVKPRPVTNSSGGTIMGVIRGSGRGVIRADTTFSGSSSLGAVIASPTSTSSERIPLGNSELMCTVTPFKTDASALSSYTPTQPVAAGSGKRRFSETPVQAIVPQTAYRDRAAERRSRYGSSFNDDLSDDLVDSNCDYPSRKGHLPDMSTMPFPPGVGGGRSSGDLPNYEVITADRAIDEKNVGNRMLRSMGWQDGLGLGKDGSGIKEPVQARAVEDRSGLGSRQRRAVDNDLEALPGDSYKTIIQKKAIARFREMS